MTRRLDNIVEAVGKTPLVRLRNVGKDVRGVELWAKLEFMNPGGSVKDRAGLQMMKDALADGRLTKDKILIDSTSGNTGVAYAWIGAALGIRVTLVMPSNVTEARKKITSAYGAEIVFSDPMEGSDGAIHHVRRIVAENPEKYFYPDQYSNESNPKAHYLGTGPEILEAVGDRLTHLVAGIGTGGTIMGAGRRLKEHRQQIQVVGIEPENALHGLEGLKHMASSIVPAIFHRDRLDEVLAVTTEDGWDMTERLSREEGLYVGHSGGAAVWGALSVARRIEKGCIVAIIPDRGDRYMQAMQWEKHYEW